jgi:hypothetical protein
LFSPILPDTFEDFNDNALLGEAGEEAADDVWRPTHRGGDLWPAGGLPHDVE